MEKRIITTKQIVSFGQFLRQEERSAATVEKYLREVGRLAAFLKGREVDKTGVAQWKESLLAQHYNPATINGKLSAIDRFLAFMGWEDCRVKHLRLQRGLFRESDRELTKEEYERLIVTAHKEGKERLCLLMETICATGIRVSEVRYITAEAAEEGKAEISLKGKIRTILIPGKLRRKLLKYARKNKIASGELFLTRSGHSLSRKQIWAEMKTICQKAGVEPGKVFPHNLRHLFARIFYQVCRDVWHAWPMFWATAASKPPASILFPLAWSTPELWSRCDWYYRTESSFCFMSGQFVATYPAVDIILSLCMQKNKYSCNAELI